MRLQACVTAAAAALGLLALGWAALPAQADTHGVVGDGTPGTCDQTEFENEVALGGHVTFDCGPDPVTITLYVGSGTQAPPGTTIDGGTRGRIILSGDGSERLFQLALGDSLTLTHLVLTAGYAGAPGGALYNVGGTLLLDDVTVQNSQALSTTYGGGALYNQAGVATVRDSLFLENDSAGGGAIYNDSTGLLYLRNTRLINNTSHALYGGAITNLGTLSMTGGLFQGNLVTYTSSVAYPIGGGAVMNYGIGLVELDGVALVENETGLAFTNQWVGGAIMNVGTLKLTNSQVQGNVSARGGGIYNYGSTTVHNTIVQANAAVLGAGIFNEEGSLSVQGGSLSGNTASTHGGALYTGWNMDSVTAGLTGTAVLDNHAGQNGGAIYLYKGLLTISGAHIAGNRAEADGGGIYTYLGSLRMADSTVRGNLAASGDGGGMLVYSPVSVQGVTLDHNRAGRDGGGLANLNGVTSGMTNTTLSANVAARHGGGLYNTGQLHLRHVTLAFNSAVAGGGLYNFSFAGVTALLTNTLIANSPLGGNCFGPPLPAKYSLDSDATCALTGTGNLNNQDAQLAPLGDYGGPTWTHMLRLGSPALNAVVGSDAALVDQRGLPRPVGAYDIGAVERQTGDTGLAPRLWLPAVGR
jgi:hypothetical protein